MLLYAKNTPVVIGSQTARVAAGSLGRPVENFLRASDKTTRGVSVFQSDQKCFCPKARPEPDLRYSSNAEALASSLKAW
jgi:hypothetical protein